MRIASVEVVPYALPFARAVRDGARQRSTQREMVLLRLRAEDGLVGLGEAVPLSLRGGATLSEVVEELESGLRLEPREASSEASVCAATLPRAGSRPRRAARR